MCRYMTTADLLQIIIYWKLMCSTIFYLSKDIRTLLWRTTHISSACSVIICEHQVNPNERIYATRSTERQIIPRRVLHGIKLRSHNIFIQRNEFYDNKLALENANKKYEHFSFLENMLNVLHLLNKGNKGSLYVFSILRKCILTFVLV